MYNGRYPRLRRRFGDRFVGYIQLVRPLTLVTPLMAGVFGVLTPVRNFSLSHLTTAIYIGLTLALSQACGQCLNQYADAELDAMLPMKKERPIPSGLITREEALGLSWLLALFAIGRAFTVSVFFGLIVLILIFFAVFYSLAPLSPRKVHPLVNILWMGISRGFLPVFAVLSVYGDLSNAWRYSIFAFFWCLSLQGSKDISDSEVDREFGIKTLPNTYGIKGFLIYATIVTAIMYFYSSLYIPSMLILMPLSVIALLGLNRKVEGVENNLGWICYYAGLGGVYFIMFITEHIS